MGYEGIHFRSSLPYPPADALSKAPVKWDIGTGSDAIRMATPLFTFAALQAYKQMTWSIKMRVLDQNPISLSTLLDSIVRYDVDGIAVQFLEEQEQTVRLAIREYILAFQNRFGVDFIPSELTDLLVGVSHPMDWEHTLHVIKKWCKDHSLVWDVPHQFNEKTRPKCYEILRDFAVFNCAVGEVCLAINYLERINTEVKKKVLIDEILAESESKRASRRLLASIRG